MRERAGFAGGINYRASHIGWNEWDVYFTAHIRTSSQAVYYYEHVMFSARIGQFSALFFLLLLLIATKCKHFIYCVMGC